MGFQFKKDDNAAIAAGKGGALDTGVHKVKIVGAYLGKTEKGNNTLDLELEGVNGGKASIFGMCIDEKWASGQTNHDYSRWSELAAVTGMATGSTTAVKRKDFNGVESDAESFDELVGKVVTVAIQMQYDVYQNKEKKRRNLSRTFFENGQSLAEKQSGTPAKQSISLASSMKDYETKAFKDFKAGGSVAQDANHETNSVSESDAADLL